MGAFLRFFGFLFWGPDFGGVRNIWCPKWEPKSGPKAEPNLGNLFVFWCNFDEQRPRSSLPWRALSQDRVGACWPPIGNKGLVPHVFFCLFCFEPRVYTILSPTVPGCVLVVFVSCWFLVLSVAFKFSWHVLQNPGWRDSIACLQCWSALFVGWIRPARVTGAVFSLAALCVSSSVFTSRFYS